MEIQKRVQDASQIFDRRWQVNNNYKEKQEFFNARQQHFNKMYNIKDRNEKKQEILRANSVEGQIASLNQRMQAVSSGEQINRLNQLKNNFR